MKEALSCFVFSACRVNFEYAYNTTSVGGLFISEITSQLQCFDSCVTLPDCLGFDLSGPDYSLCWLYFNPENFRQKYFKLNVFQYSINRCPEQGRSCRFVDISCGAPLFLKWGSLETVIISYVQSNNDHQRGSRHSNTKSISSNYKLSKMALLK